MLFISKAVLILAKHRHRMLYDASQSRGENKNGESDGRQAGRGDKAESLGPVHVRVWAKDKDCYEKR